MTYKEQIMQFVRCNDGTITTSQLNSMGILRGNLTALVAGGQLERVSRGVYTLPSVWEDEMLCLQQRYKRGVYSHATALFLHNLTDRTPVRYSMTFPVRYNAANPKATGITCYRMKHDFYTAGITTVSTPAGNAVRAYCPERALCDMLRPISGADIQVTTEAFKRYTARRSKNIPLLSEYGRLLRVEGRLRAYLEVLL